MSIRPLLLFVLGLAASGCVHAPPPRPVAAGERILLDAVELQLPAEPGWEAWDTRRDERRVLRLAHRSASGGFDADAIITERRAPPRPPSPAEFLAWAQTPPARDDELLTFTPSPAESVVTDDRFGPLSVRASFQFAPKRPEAGVRAGTAEWRAFVTSEPLPPRLVTAISKKALDGAAPTGGAALFDGLRLRGHGVEGEPAPSGSVPDVESRGLAIAGLGAAVAAFEGEQQLGIALKVGFLGEAFFPRAAEGYGRGLNLHCYIGGNSDTTSSAVALEAGLHAVRGRIRYGLGLDLGILSKRLGEKNQVDELTAGSRAFASVDFFRGPNSTIALELEGAAMLRGFFQASLNLVARLDSAAVRPPNP